MLPIVCSTFVISSSPPCSSFLSSTCSSIICILHHNHVRGSHVAFLHHRQVPPHFFPFLFFSLNFLMFSRFISFLASSSFLVRSYFLSWFLRFPMLKASKPKIQCMKRYENWELNTYIEKKITARPNKSNILSTIVRKFYQIVECGCHWCQRTFVMTNE